MPSVKMYWSNDDLYHNSIFSKTMSQNRFFLIQEFLHFKNRKSPNYNSNEENRDK